MSAVSAADRQAAEATALFVHAREVLGDRFEPSVSVDDDDNADIYMRELVDAYFALPPEER